MNPELLIEVKEFLDRIYAEDLISSGDLGEIYGKVIQEIAYEEKQLLFPELEEVGAIQS